MTEEDYFMSIFGGTGSADQDAEDIETDEAAAERIWGGIQRFLEKLEASPRK